MKLRDLFKRAETRDAGNDPSWQRMLGIEPSTAGVHVDVKAAEGIAAVFACVQALSESTAALPLHVYQRLPNGSRQRADDHPLARVLEEPNGYMSGFTFRESMIASVLLHGNAYAVIERNASGELSALNPIDPRSVSIVRLASGRYAYDHAQPDGGTRRYLSDEIWHLKDRCEPGSIVGKSRIAVARESLGLSLSLRQHGASTFKNAARPSGLLIPQKSITTEQAIDIKKVLDNHAGGINSGKLLILPHATEFKQLSLSMEDAQWLAGMQYGTEEVCRIFRVPPTMVADLRFGSYQNTAELGSQYVRYSLSRWIAMFETEAQRSLLGPIARQRYYIEHSVEGLLRGNPEARADFYQKAIAAGWMLPSEVRQLENLPAIDGIDAIDSKKSLPA